MRRHLLARAATALLLAAPLTLAAQAATDTTARPRPREPGIAFAAAMVLPGAGHFYAHENNRGWAHLIIHAATAPVVYSGRTDRTGKIVGAIFLANYVLNLVDAPGAVKRYNRRLTITAPPPGRDAAPTLRLGIAFSP